jgi:MFS family permease
MMQTESLIHNRMTTPRAAAVAGIVLSALLITALLLLRLSMPVDRLKPESWLRIRPARVVLALNLVPFAGIAFLWFIGVLRDRLGALEDRFFATVFLGSGLLFLAMLFVGAAGLGGLIMVLSSEPQGLLGSPTFSLARALISNIANVYAIRMAAVFMVVTSTLVIRTGFAPRWMAFLGYALSLPLLFGSRFLDWGFGVFPLWVFLISVHILADNLRRPSQPAAEE